MKKSIKIFIDNEWINGNTCINSITDFYERIRAKMAITKMRSDFVRRLMNEGYNIITDRRLIDDQTIFFIMDDKYLCDDSVPLEEYKKIFDERMFLMGGKHLNYPQTLKFCDYLNNPFYPAVLKNELANGGVDKFLIETSEQLEIIKKFYQDKCNDVNIQELFKSCIFQQYIETPSLYDSYIRVLASSSGDIMGASLRYSNVSCPKKEISGELEKYFLDPKSPYYLDCKTMFNYYSKGDIIYFNQPGYSKQKKNILDAHLIDSNNPVIPTEVIDVVTSIMKNCNRELGLICGFDFIMNKHDGKWYYLENQSFPAIDEWAQTKNIKIPKGKDLNGYIKYLELDMYARYEALNLYLSKLLENEENNMKLSKSYN